MEHGKTGNDPGSARLLAIRRVIGFCGFFTGIGLVIAGIGMIVAGDSFFGQDSQLWWDLSTNGAMTLFIGAGMAMFSPVAFITTSRSRLASTGPGKHVHPGWATGGAGPGGTMPANVPERVIVREVVKVRCTYCHALVDLVAGTCPNCGASL